MTWRCARAARLLAGEPCAALGEPLAAHAPLPPRPRLRAHEYLVMAVPLIWQQMPDRIGLLALARQALGAPVDEREAVVLELLALAERTWPVELEHGDRSEILTVSWLTFRLVELADALVMAAETPRRFTPRAVGYRRSLGSCRSARARLSGGVCGVPLGDQLLPPCAGRDAPSAEREAHCDAGARSGARRDVEVRGGVPHQAQAETESGPRRGRGRDAPPASRTTTTRASSSTRASRAKVEVTAPSP